MKKYALFLGLLLAPLFSLAQTFFEYDQAGNRIKRTFTPVPNLVSSLVVRPTTVYPSDPITVQLYVIEINGMTTSGLITVKLSKQATVNLNFNPATTAVAGTPVQNANWSFDNSDPSYYVFTSTTAINAGNGGIFSIIGLEGTVSSTPNSGLLVYSAVILGGSGGEIKIDDNVSTAKVDVFN